MLTSKFFFKDKTSFDLHDFKCWFVGFSSFLNVTDKLCYNLTTWSVPHFLPYTKYCPGHQAPAHIGKAVNIGWAGSIANSLGSTY